MPTNFDTTSTTPVRLLQQSKLNALHLLRGIAALMVFYAHLFAVGVNDTVTPHAYVPAITRSPVAEAQRGLGANYLWLELLLGRSGINFGHLGVMLFFLISGVVISFSINRTDPITFLIRRALRIYPTCFAAVALTIAGVTLYCQALGVPYFFPFNINLNSALLISGWVGQGAVIPVLWPLSAEIAFYVLIALVVSLTRSKLGAKEILLAGSVCCGVIALGTAQPDWLKTMPATTASIKWTIFLAPYVAYMLIGASLAMALRGKQSKLVKFLSFASAILIYCLAAFLFDPTAPSLGTEIAGSLKILTVFTALLFFGKNIGEWRITNFLGDISYPLYLLHVPLCWVILYEVTRRGLSLHIAVATAIIVVISLAWLLHVLIEKPSQALSQKFRIKRLPIIVEPVVAI